MDTFISEKKSLNRLCSWGTAAYGSGRHLSKARGLSKMKVEKINKPRHRLKNLSSNPEDINFFKILSMKFGVWTWHL